MRHTLNVILKRRWDLQYHVAAHSRLVYGSRSIVLFVTPARVTLLIQFSSRILRFYLCPDIHTALYYISSFYAESQGTRGCVGARGGCSLPFLCGRVAYRSMNIKSSRIYNLLTHCSPSGVRRLAGSWRMKYIRKQTPRYTHRHTSLLKFFQVHRLVIFFQSWHGTPGELAALHGLWHMDQLFTSQFEEETINVYRKQCKELKFSIP